MATATAKGQTYQFEDHGEWEIAVARERHRRWFGFARRLGDPDGRFTVTAGPAPGRAEAIEAIKLAVDAKG